jgi:hypothetical protein
LFFAAVLIVESCKNNDEVFPNIKPCFFNVVNASPDTLNFYLNGTRQNDNSSLFPGSASGYTSINSGSENIQFKKNGGFNDLFSVPLVLTDSLNYSLFVTGTSASGAFNSVDILDTTGLGSSYLYFKVRFVNASPNAGNLDVSVGDSISFSAKAFKTISLFVAGGAGIKEVKIFPSGSTTNPLVDTSITFQADNLYTIFSKGQLNGKGSSAFNVGVTLNPFY